MCAMAEVFEVHSLSQANDNCGSKARVVVVRIIKIPAHLWSC